MSVLMLLKSNSLQIYKIIFTSPYPTKKFIFYKFLFDSSYEFHIRYDSVSRNHKPSNIQGFLSPFYPIK